MNPAVFLDRDGTIVEDVGVVSRPNQLVFLPRAVEALRLLGRYFRLFIVTNQSGVAHGTVSHEQILNVHRHLLNELRRQGVHIERVFYCPHDRQDGCACIKPKPHFLDVARREHNIDLSASYAIGDHPHDVDFATNGGATGIYVLTGHGQKHRGELASEARVADDLWDAARMILDRIDPKKMEVIDIDSQDNPPEQASR